MATASKSKMVATKNVDFIPAVSATEDAEEISATPLAKEKIDPITDAPEIRPIFLERLNSPETTPRSFSDTFSIMAVLFAAWKS